MEKKNIVKKDNEKANLFLEDRRKLNITGVTEVINFDEEKISLNTILGKLSIKGRELKMDKLDVQNGNVSIMGNIDSMIYSTKKPKKVKCNFIKRYFIRR